MTAKPIPPKIRAWLKRHPWATLAWVRAWLGRRRHPKPTPTPTPAPPPPPTPATLTMWDTITPAELPAKAEAVAGYVDGQWRTFPGLAKSHPNAHRLSITVTGEAAADCVDIERGDATPARALAWFKSHRATNMATPKPVLYTSVSEADDLISLFAAAGVPRSSYLLWTSHYTGRPHLCGPQCNGAGVTFTHHADATQYAGSKILGRNVDKSQVRAGFFRGA